MTRGCLSLTDGPSLAERPCPQQDRPGGLCCTTTLPLLASALAVQPWSVLAPVLLVTAEGGVAKTMAYVAGWVLALAATALATVSLYPETPKVASSSPWVTWVQLAAGVALGGWLLVGMRRPVAATSDAQGRGTQPLSSQPKWTARLESMTPPPAFAFGAFLLNHATVDPAIGNVVQAGLSQGWATVVLMIFIIVASAGVSAPLLALVFGRQDAPGISRVAHLRVEDGHRLLTVVRAVVAVVLITNGIVGLVI